MRLIKMIVIPLCVVIGCVSLSACNNGLTLAGPHTLVEQKKEYMLGYHTGYDVSANEGEENVCPGGCSVYFQKGYHNGYMEGLGSSTISFEDAFGLDFIVQY
jgi:hypothetical protein